MKHVRSFGFQMGIASLAMGLLVPSLAQAADKEIQLQKAESVHMSVDYAVKLKTMKNKSITLKKEDSGDNWKVGFAIDKKLGRILILEQDKAGKKKGSIERTMFAFKVDEKFALGTDSVKLEATGQSVGLSSAVALVEVSAQAQNVKRSCTVLVDSQYTRTGSKDVAVTTHQTEETFNLKILHSNGGAFATATWKKTGANETSVDLSSCVFSEPAPSQETTYDDSNYDNSGSYDPGVDNSYDTDADARARAEDERLRRDRDRRSDEEAATRAAQEERDRSAAEDARIRAERDRRSDEEAARAREEQERLAAEDTRIREERDRRSDEEAAARAAEDRAAQERSAAEDARIREERDRRSDEEAASRAAEQRASEERASQARADEERASQARADEERASQARADDERRASEAAREAQEQASRAEAQQRAEQERSAAEDARIREERDRRSDPQ